MEQLGKPLRLTRTNLLKISRAGTIIKNRENYPKSQELLYSLVESRSTYQIRCVTWAIAELRANGEKITEKRILAMTNIGKVDSADVMQKITQIASAS